MNRIFYKPEGAWAGDFIPFYQDGKFHLFYLHHWRKNENFGEGIPWYRVSTEDFINFTEHGQVLCRGSKEEQDLYVFTGSVIESKGLYHIFYTGHNPYFCRKDKPAQAIMHAVSKDLIEWNKVAGDTFFAPTDKYEPHDWRDPFVFWNEEMKEFRMLLAARLKSGPSRRRGCTVLAVSKDLKKWEVRKPFWAPGLYITHECPDLFRIGDWWYLVYSTYSERHSTHYRMSRSLNGPWTAPENDTFDGRAFYAAKSASDGRSRFLFGWNPTREGENDEGNWEWGGNLVIHEIVQEKGGFLSVKIPEKVDRFFAKPVPFQLKPALSDSKIGRRLAEIWTSGFGCVTAGRMPRQCKIETKVMFTRRTRGCGIMLRVSEDFENAYYIRLEPGRNRLVFDKWPRSGDLPFAVGLERPIELTEGKPVELKVLVEDTICEVYAAGKVALSARFYNLKKGLWGLFVNEGEAGFKETRLYSG